MTEHTHSQFLIPTFNTEYNLPTNSHPLNPNPDTNTKSWKRGIAHNNIPKTQAPKVEFQISNTTAIY